MIIMLGAIAGFERRLLLERQREGVAKAKLDGKYKGRRPTARAKAAEVIRLNAEGLQRTEIAWRTGIGVASVYRVLADAKIMEGNRKVAANGLPGPADWAFPFTSKMAFSPDEKAGVTAPMRSTRSHVASSHWRTIQP
jgi:hypothetical protein